MCGEVHPVGTDRVLGSAYLDGLGLIERPDDDRRLAEEVHRAVVWHCEEHDRGDVVGHLGVHRFGYGRRIDPIRYGRRGDEAHHRRALGITAEDHLGVGAVVRHRNDMRARVSNAVLARTRPVMGSGVVDRIYVERFCTNAWAQGVDECLSGRADPGRVVGAAGEHDLKVRTRIGGGGRDCRREDGSANARRRDYRRSKETREVTCDHAAVVPMRMRFLNRDFQALTAVDQRRETVGYDATGLTAPRCAARACDPGACSTSRGPVTWGI
jgi:hypothetical protein